MECSLAGSKVVLVCAVGVTARVLLLGLAQSLKSAGAHVGFAFRFDGRDEQELGTLGFDCTNVPFSRMPFDLLSHVRALLGYRRMLRQAQPDLVLLSTAFPAVIGRLARRSGTKVVLLAHGSYWDDGVRPPVRAAWDLCERALAGRADLVLTNNSEDRDDMVRVGNAPDRVRHMPGGLRGVDLERFGRATLSAEERTERRRKLDLPGCTLVGFFGRLTPAKGVLNLCIAADLLRDVDVHFLFAGPAGGRWPAALPGNRGSVAVCRRGL